MADFTDILNKPVDQVEKPKAKPPGFYVSQVNGMPKQKQINVQGEMKNVLSFNLKPLSVHKDVDMEELALHPEVHTWPGINRDFWIDDEQGQFNLKRFLADALGIDPGPKGKSKTLSQMCAEAPGKQVITEYALRPWVDKEGEAQISTEIKSTAAL